MINKNILIVGGTGCGKSVLCNVLTNTDEFKEGEYTVSETLKIQIRCFGLNGIKYSVVDTVGIGNINVIARDVLSSIIEKINSISEGISQVLLVTDGRFQAEEIVIYDLLKDIFKAGFVTIVRTNFANFQNKDECKKDIKKMLDRNNRIAEITRSCEVIHVDNPPTDIKCENVSDVEEIRKTNEMNSRYRKKSREKLLNHLEKVCQNDKTKMWKKIFGSIKMIKKK